jgi:putative colanic acid biosysnthesis UDP-glucose lipid carrier transferase
MNNNYINLFRFFFVCVDLIVLNAVYYLVMVSTDRVPPNAEYRYVVLYFASNMLWLVAAYCTGLYINNSNPSSRRFIQRSTKSLIWFYVLIMMFVFIYHYSFSRLFILISLSGFGVLLLISRMLFLGASYYFNKASRVTKRVVIVGYNEVAKKLAYSFATHNRNLSVEGYFEDLDLVNELSSLPIIGNVDECVSYAVDNQISEIFSTISPEKNNSLYELAQIAEKALIRFKFVPDFKFYVNRNTHIEYLNDFPILSLRPEPLEEITNRIKKRVFDTIFSFFVILFVLSWLLPLMAILIKLNSRGPVFFVQWRSGKNNKQFRCYKLRTLSVNGDANIKQVTRDDRRITSLGRFLRKANLDELPQFFNVFFGSMSVVGPRPHMLRHTESYSKLLQEYMVRHFVKPGVTGWAQVNGYRGEIKKEGQLHKRIEYDIWYMEHWSLWLDLRVICLTIYRTFKGDKNAY